MSRIRTLKSVLAGICAGTMVFSAGSVIPVGTLTKELDANAAGACTVNTNKTYQRIRGFGGMNHPEWQSVNLTANTTGDMTAEQVQTAFGNGANELGLTILRIFVSDQQNAWNNAIPTAQRAQKLGATVFATPWNPPASMRSNGSGGPRGGQYVLNNGAEANYAKHLNDFVKFCEGKGVTLNSVSVQNEPDWSGEWTYWSPDRAASFLANYGPSVTAGTSAKMMSPESFSYSKDYYNAILNNAKAFENCDMFGTHFYGTQRSAMDFPALEQCGKEIWMTEVYVPNSDNNSADRWPEGVQVAENIHNALVVGNMNAYVWWYVRRQYSFLWDNGNISKRGYAMAQFSKWVRPGDVRVDATEQPNTNILVSAYKHSDTQATIVAINKGSGAVSQEFQLSGRSISGIDGYRTSGSENIAKISGLSGSGSSFTAQLPANSVSTFVVTMASDGKDLPEDPDQPIVREPITPDANGYYYHDTFEESSDEWEGRGGASVSTGGTAYAGSKALTVSDRGSAWHGAMKTLDSLTFKAGEEYSFSVAASGSGNMMLSLQYTDASGETKYDHIASGESSGDYVQLSNTNYKLPEGSGYILYVETEEGTSDFSIDEAIVAKAGTKIDGPKPVQPVNVIAGDINGDEKVDTFDLVLARKGAVSGLTGTALKAGDVNGDGQMTVADLVQISEFVLGKRKSFEKDPTATTTAATQQVVTTTTEAASGNHLSMKDFTAKVASTIAEKEPDSANQAKGGVTYGEIQNKTYYSNVCKRNKKYNVLLPPNYDKNKKYPVMYILHGYYENPDRMLTKGNAEMHTREMLGNAIAEGAAKEMICVFPDVYSSATQDAVSGMDNNNNNAYDNFINQLTKDLMPEIEKNYSVLTGKDNTAITGFSMGGRESLLIGMKMADQIGYIGAICPAPGVTGSFKWDSGKEPYFLMITAGSNDQTVYDNPKNYHNSFEQNGVPHVWHYVNGGYHGDNCIRAHLYNFFRIAFQN
ncbi:MAG: carbohydrate binding domain-containing protein [Ruminococcus sp.]|nr:carbohydrate binding domain-containing protein [Ruminococcus sp.]